MYMDKTDYMFIGFISTLIGIAIGLLFVVAVLDSNFKKHECEWYKVNNVSIESTPFRCLETK